jgi:hypothetical protein
MKQYKNTVNTSTRITKTLAQLSEHPHIRKPIRYKTHTYPHPHITKEVKTTTVQDTHQIKWSQYIQVTEYKVTLMCTVLLSPRTST